MKFRDLIENSEVNELFGFGGPEKAMEKKIKKECKKIKGKEAFKKWMQEFHSEMEEGLQKLSAAKRTKARQNIYQNLMGYVNGDYFKDVGTGTLKTILRDDFDFDIKRLVG